MEFVLHENAVPFCPLDSLLDCPSSRILFSKSLSSSRLLPGTTVLPKAEMSWIGVLESRSRSEELTPPVSAIRISESCRRSSFVSDCFSSFSFSSPIVSFVLITVLNAEGNEICLPGSRFALSSSSRNLLVVEKESCLSVLQRRNTGLPGVSR